MLAQPVPILSTFLQEPSAWGLQLRLHLKAWPGQGFVPRMMGLGVLSLCLAELVFWHVGKNERDKQVPGWKHRLGDLTVILFIPNLYQEKGKARGYVCTISEVSTALAAPARQNSLKEYWVLSDSTTHLVPLCLASVSHPSLPVASCYVTAQSISTTACAIPGSLWVSGTH